MLYAFPINAPNARTLFGGFRLAVADFRFTRETGAGQEVNIFEETFTGVLAATGDLTLGLTLPVVEKELEFKTATGRTSQITASGLAALTSVWPGLVSAEIEKAVVKIQGGMQCSP